MIDLVTPVVREVPKPSSSYKRLSVRSHAKGTFHQVVDDPNTIAMDKLYAVHKDDLIVNITFAWEHAIAVAGEKDHNLLVSHRFPTFLIDKSDKNFIKYFVTLKRFKNLLDLISPGGAGRNRVLNKKDFNNLKVFVPVEMGEQTQIGSFFKKLDETISLHQQELDTLKQTKQGFLQKMFPKNGEDKPTIRFKGFNEPWGRENFETVCEKFEYGLNASAKEYDGTNQYIRITDIDDESRTFLKSNLTSPDYDLNTAKNYLLKKGDLLFARTGASVGKTYLYDEDDGIVYFAGFLIRGRIKESYDPEFIFQITLTSNFKGFINISSQRSGQPGINAKEIGTYNFLIPEYEEQVKIGEFFRQLDEVIKLKEKELEALKETKKGFLQKMFV